MTVAQNYVLKYRSANMLEFCVESSTLSVITKFTYSGYSGTSLLPSRQNAKGVARDTRDTEKSESRNCCIRSGSIQGSGPIPTNEASYLCYYL